MISILAPKDLGGNGKILTGFKERVAEGDLGYRLSGGENIVKQLVLATFPR